MLFYISYKFVSITKTVLISLHQSTNVWKIPRTWSIFTLLFWHIYFFKNQYNSRMMRLLFQRRSCSRQSSRSTQVYDYCGTKGEQSSPTTSTSTTKQDLSVLKKPSWNILPLCYYYFGLDNFKNKLNLF